MDFETGSQTCLSPRYILTLRYISTLRCKMYMQMLLPLQYLDSCRHFSCFLATPCVFSSWSLSLVAWHMLHKLGLKQCNLFIYQLVLYNWYNSCGKYDYTICWCGVYIFRIWICDRVSTCNISVSPWLLVWLSLNSSSVEFSINLIKVYWAACLFCASQPFFDQNWECYWDLFSLKGEDELIWAWRHAQEKTLPNAADFLVWQN